MTVSNKVLIPAKQVENVQTTQYSPLNSTAIIDKATVTNTSGANVLFSVNIVTVGNIAGTDNLIINQRAIAPKETYSCVELVGQTLGPGDFISTISGTALALTMRVSGREIV